MIVRFFHILALLAAGTSLVFSRPLADATVEQAFGDIQIVEATNKAHAASHHETVRKDAAVIASLHARAELVFPDNTLVRLGGETALHFGPGTRELRLDRGTLLLQVPGFRGGARVLAGLLVATVGRATFLIEHLPTKSLKIAVLEGDLRVSVNKFLGDSIILKPGKLLITAPNAQRLPEPVDIDLRTLAKTSTLINSELFQGTPLPAGEPLQSMPFVERGIARQDKLIQEKNLIPTNLAILGSGTSIVIPAEAPTADGSESGNRNAAEIAMHGEPEKVSEEKIPLKKP